MTTILTLIAENIIVVIGFTIYAGLVYYIIYKCFHRASGRKHHKSERNVQADILTRFKDKTGSGENAGGERLSRDGKKTSPKRRDFSNNPGTIGMAYFGPKRDA